MVIIGLDMSTTSTGFGVFRDDKLIDCGIIKPSAKDDWENRCYVISDQISKMIEKYNPDVVCIEDVPLKKTGQLSVAIQLGYLQGMVVKVFREKNVPYEKFAPTKWRGKIPGMFEDGNHRDILKRKAISMCNDFFKREINKIRGKDLAYVSPTSSKNEDDVAEAILIAYSYNLSEANKRGVVSAREGKGKKKAN